MNTNNELSTTEIINYHLLISTDIKICDGNHFYRKIEMHVNANNDYMPYSIASQMKTLKFVNTSKCLWQITISLNHI